MIGTQEIMAHGASAWSMYLFVRRKHYYFKCAIIMQTRLLKRHSQKDKKILCAPELNILRLDVRSPWGYEMFNMILSSTLCSTLRTCMITISKVRHYDSVMNIEAKMWNKMHGYGSILWCRALFKLWAIEHLNPMFLSLVAFIYTWILFVKSRICKN